MRNLDITTLRSLIAIADQGGVTRAAQMLNLTQSAVSMQVKRLEDMLGQTLLDRSQRKISLTPTGEQLVSYARRIVGLNDELITRLTDEHYQGELTLGVPHDIIYPHIPQVLKHFAAAMPRVQVHLISSNTAQLHESLTKGQVDLILTTEQETQPGGETLTEQPLLWVGACGSSIWKQRPLPVAFGKECIFKPIALQKLDAAGIDWSLRIDSDDDRPNEIMISADLAIGAMLRNSIPPHLEAIPQSASLPPLAGLKINLYGRTSSDDVTITTLRGLIRQAYGAPNQTTLSVA